MNVPSIATLHRLYSAAALLALTVAGTWFWDHYQLQREVLALPRAERRMIAPSKRWDPFARTAKD